VTAVEVTRVSQPSAWQQRYRRFSAEQQRLLARAESSHAND
jgi:formate dehydrogenase major subunit